MAKSTIDVTGLKIKDIMNIDIETFNKLNKADLRKLTGRLVSASNKRLRRFERDNSKSPATVWASRSGGKFSTKGKNVNQLRAEFMRAKSFLESETSTKKGWDEVKRKTSETLKENGVDLTLEEFEDMWEIYEMLKETDPNVKLRKIKYKVLYDVLKISRGDPIANKEEIAARIRDDLDRIYREEKAKKDNGTAQYFEGQ